MACRQRNDFLMSTALTLAAVLSLFELLLIFIGVKREVLIWFKVKLVR